MRWSSRPTNRAAWGVLSSIAVFFALVLAVSGFAEEKRLSVYSGTANYSLTVREKNGTDYVGLLEILQPLGPVSAGPGGPVWRLSFNRVDGEFTPGKSRAQVQGQTFDLPANFLLENGRGLVPLSSLPALMQRAIRSYRKLITLIAAGDVEGAAANWRATMQYTIGSRDPGERVVIAAGT